MNAETERLLNEIKDALIYFMGDEAAEVGLNDDLTETLGFDSLDRAEFAMLLEDHFDWEFPDEDVEKWSSYNSILRYFADNEIGPVGSLPSDL